MKLLGIWALLALLVANSLGCEKKPDDTKKIQTGFVDIDLKNNRVLLTVRKTDGTKMQNILLTKVADPTKLGKLTLKKDCETYTTCVQSGDLTVAKVKANPADKVIKISRVIADESGELSDCYQMADETEWFGGPQIRYQHWPIQNMYFEEEPYVPTHPTNIAVAERYWLSSRGIYLYVEQKDPLFIDMNNQKERYLCLVAKNKDKGPYQKRKQITLDYEIGVFANPREAHEYVIKSHFDKPQGYPDELMVQRPIWSTWAEYKVHVSDSVVREFANKIKSSGLSNSQLEIDDNWETCYGSAVFNSTRFPNVPKLVEDLKNLGFRTTLWIHPFINEDCSDAYNYTKNQGYFVKNEKGDVHTTWWQGGKGAGVIDFTNAKAVEWWVKRLKDLQASTKIDGFKFDAGEVSWLPQIPKLTGPEELQPGIYTKNYTTILSKNFNNLTEARVGWGTQGLPIFVRMIDKDTRYTWNNGLPTLITTLIQMNLNGYLFVLPDMIGGNGYVGNSFEVTEAPPEDMFIRWLQANVFMPSLQFSFGPWRYSEKAVQICKKYVELHEKISSTIIELMKNAKSGAPINPPIWWIDPLNRAAHKIYDEFLLGEKYLVAPVIEENASIRDVYLPAGKWRDGNDEKKVYAGPILLKDYPAPIEILPYFEKIQ